MTPKVAVIADDLTGALDCSTPFALAGLRVAAATRPEWLGEALASGAEVVVVSTASRALDAGQAARLAGTAAAAIGKAGIAFKKIDSRLKGNVLAETQAAMAGFGRDRAVVAPAVIDQDRPTIGGSVTGRGLTIPLPIRPHAPAGAVIADAASDEDLDRVVAAHDWSRTLAVGARGLGLAFARTFGGERATPFVPSVRTLLAIGSHDPITLAQIERIRDRVTCHEATLGVFDQPSGPLPALIHSTGPFAGPDAAISRRFAASVMQAVEVLGPDTLVMSGGDTALAILDALGAHVVLPQGEAAPGLPWFLIQRENHPSIRCIVKSGGFGDEHTLDHLLAK